MSMMPQTAKLVAEQTAVLAIFRCELQSSKNTPGTRPETRPLRANPQRGAEAQEKAPFRKNGEGSVVLVAVDIQFFFWLLLNCSYI